MPAGGGGGGERGSLGSWGWTLSPDPSLQHSQASSSQSRVSGHYCARTTPFPVRGAQLFPTHSGCALPWGASQCQLPRTTPGPPAWSFCFFFFCDLERRLLPHPAKSTATQAHSSSSFSLAPEKTAGLRDLTSSLAGFQMQNPLLSPSVFGKENPELASCVTLPSAARRPLAWPRSPEIAVFGFVM